jgi:arylsulfatase A-like enzyme
VVFFEYERYSRNGFDASRFSKKKGEYLTERLTEESVKFLEERDKDKPFLLYLSYYNIHTPIQAYKKRIEHYNAKAAKVFKGKTPTQKEHEGNSRMRQDNAALASMVAAVDDSVGVLLRKLKELKLDQNTVVIFFSDNGGLCTLQGNRFGPGCNLPLRASKGWLYEGDTRGTNDRRLAYATFVQPSLTGA